MEEFEVAIKVTTQTYGAVECVLPTNSTVRELKNVISKELRRRSPVVSPFRLLYKAKSVDDWKRICEIEPEITQNTLLELFAVDGDLKQSEAFTRVNNVRLLHRNVNECVKSGSSGANPRNRTRFNNPLLATPPRPTTEYLADVLIDIGETFGRMSKNIAQLSKLLTADKEIESDEEHEKTRRLVQNNMDSMRYASPMLMNLTKLCIPINRPQAVVQLTQNYNSSQQSR